jgi:ATP-dependent RNA helicase DeaD
MRERPVRARLVDERGNFEGGAWVSLSVGRNKAAEPRWLIPMLCKAGGITKRQIGSIYIQQDVTQVEIDAASIDEFIDRIGEGGRLEKSIHVTRLEQAPRPQPKPRAKHPGPKHAADAPRENASMQRKETSTERSPSYAKHAAKAGHKRPKAAQKGKKWNPAG